MCWRRKRKALVNFEVIEGLVCCEMLTCSNSALGDTRENYSVSLQYLIISVAIHLQEFLGHVDVLAVLELIISMTIHLQEFHAVGFCRRPLGQALEIRPENKGNNSSSPKPSISQWGELKQGWVVLRLLRRISRKVHILFSPFGSGTPPILLHSH
jgi:hypothetical protein